MGPLLLGRILNLNEIQSGVLTLVFKVADDNGLLLLDLKDLRAMVQFVGDNADTFKVQYGNVSQGQHRRDPTEPARRSRSRAPSRFSASRLWTLDDLMQTDAKGQGTINILAADKLHAVPHGVRHVPALVAVGTVRATAGGGRPAASPSWCSSSTKRTCSSHDVPKLLEEKIEQVVRLIRSKGVGVYFVTQNPLDLPDTVLGQLGNRVQHALRAFTPRDQKAVKAAAETFRANPKLDPMKAITELGVGEALVSMQDEKGVPTMVERAWVMPPQSRLAPLSPEEIAAAIQGSVLYGTYEKAIDRESAYEKLRVKAEQAQVETPKVGPATKQPKSQTEELLGALAKSAAHAIGSQVGRQIIRGVLGSIFGSGRR